MRQSPSSNEEWASEREQLGDDVSPAYTTARASQAGTLLAWSGNVMLRDRNQEERTAMTDPYRKKPKDALDEQEGEATPPTGKAYDGRNKRHGALDQTPEEAKDEQPSMEDTKRVKDESEA